MKKIAILQSNYIPWKGYFDLIAAVDEFIIYDEMQYTRRDWRNRNKIKTPQGLMWLTVPVKSRGNYYQKICEMEIDDTDWAQSHWRNLAQHYRRAKYYEEIAAWLEPLYADRAYAYLSDLNCVFLEKICSFLGITTKISSSSDFVLKEGKTERLADLCAQAGGTEYVSGPAAKDYIVPEIFQQYDIKLTWFDYNGYQPYPQLWGEFTHQVSIVDLLFNCGSKSANWLRYAPHRAEG